MESKKFKFSIKKKMLIGMMLLVTVTYAMSGLFIFFMYDAIGAKMGISEGTFTLITLLLGIIWSGVLGYFASNFITRPLQQLETAVKEVATGDIRQELQVSESDDEIRALGTAYNKMLKNLQGIVNEINRNYNDSKSKIELMVKSSKEASLEAETISKTVAEIASGAEQSASSMQVTAEMIDEVYKIAQQVHDRAYHSRDEASQLVENLNKSQTIILSLVDGIKHITEEQINSLVEVQELNKDAQEVGEIISVVGEIADRTNLLALNASIEAARAGEHGHGFSVVANEVRKLADQSSNSVKNITERIEKMQRGVSNMVTRINEQVEGTKEEALKGTQTNAAMTEMVEVVTKVSNEAEEICSLVDKQLASVEKTNRNIQEVAAIAQETSAGAEEVAASTHEQTDMIKLVLGATTSLAESSDKLKKTINKFKA
jgi:methyl-accepting chemotaxis protein